MSSLDVMAPVAVLIWLESLQRFLLDGSVWPWVCQVVRDRHPESSTRPAPSSGYYVGQVFNTTIVKVFPKNPGKNGNILIVNWYTWISTFLLSFSGDSSLLPGQVEKDWQWDHDEWNKLVEPVIHFSIVNTATQVVRACREGQNIFALAQVAV